MPVLKPVLGRYYVKQMHAQHYNGVATLQCYSTHLFWGQRQIRRLMTSRPRAYGYVVTTVANKVVASIIFRRYNQDARLHLVDLVVHPDHRQKGIGTMLVKRMVAKMRAMSGSLKGVLTVVRETNLLGQKFLYENGFRAFRVSPNFFVDEWPEVTETEDGFFFVHSPYSEFQDFWLQKAREAREGGWKDW